MPGSVRTWRAAVNAVLAAGSMLAGLAIAEAWLRWHDPFTVSTVRDASEVNEPTTTFLGGVEFEGEGNSLGLRDQDYPLEHERWRVLAIGDSFTYGLRLRAEHSWPKLTEALLRKEGLDIEVLNGGRPGTDTATQLALFTDYSSLYRPDTVVISFLINDCTDLCSNCGAVEFRKRFEALLQEDPGGLRLWRFLKLARLKRQLTEETVREYRRFYEQKLPQFQQCRQAFQDFRALSRQLDFDLVVVIYPMLFRLDSRNPFDGIHQTMLDFFREAGIDAYDLTPVFKGWRDTDLWVDALDSHPNERANRLASQRIAQIIRDRVPRRLRGPLGTAR